MYNLPFPVGSTITGEELTALFESLEGQGLVLTEIEFHFTDNRAPEIYATRENLDSVDVAFTTPSEKPVPSSYIAHARNSLARDAWIIAKLANLSTGVNLQFQPTH